MRHRRVRFLITACILTLLTLGVAAACTDADNGSTPSDPGRTTMPDAYESDATPPPGETTPAPGDIPADYPPPRRTTGTVQLDVGLGFAVEQAVIEARELLYPSTHYAITAVDVLGEGWSLVSVVGLGGMEVPHEWNLTKHMVDVGLVLIQESPAESGDGDESGGRRIRYAYQGTRKFSSLIQLVPDDLLSPDAKIDLDPLSTEDNGRADVPGLPWTEKARMAYGIRGVHSNGFRAVPDWLAVDFVSVPDTPNRVTAATGGAIGYRCEPNSEIGELSTGFQIGDFFYTHVVDHDDIRSGRTVEQGEHLGAMQKGTFGGEGTGFHCGYGVQGDETFHLHFGFANQPALALDMWTLTMEDELWRSGDDALTAGECCLTAGNDLPPTPTPIATPTAARTATFTPTPTPTLTPTPTFTPTPTPTPTQTPTSTPVPTNTPLPWRPRP